MHHGDLNLEGSPEWRGYTYMYVYMYVYMYMYMYTHIYVSYIHIYDSFFCTVETNKNWKATILQYKVT